MSVQSIVLGILFIIFCISIIKMSFPNLMKKTSFRVYLLLSFYWAIGGFTINPFSKGNVANIVGFIVIWSWVGIMLLVLTKRINGRQLKNDCFK
ncbi:hypothetical protein P4645_15565 [Lysinibacillus fusiformis]|uniref:hypothetical protein n=1 Tax=Lysinibacillus fusiformis TaxID=28031 RepID=UPI002E20DCA4|nr:hypothetical protein [Lysinibacillus fusiformis]